MKQVFQDLKNGKTIIENVPFPYLKDNEVIVKSFCSLISPGTERMLASFGKANLLNKAKKQPEKVKDVLDKIVTDGLIETYQAVNQKLEESIPLGYSNVGIILEVGCKVKGLKVGDRVASNGPHAEVFAVNQNLCALVPDNVSNQEAVFTVIASVGLQGLRLSKPSYGETFLVSGLGLIGQITAQLLIANGCQVLGVDLDERKCSLANSFGVKTFNITKNENQVAWCLKNTSDLGIDGAIVTATSNSSIPINLAAKACRKNGRVILVGATPINLSRNIFYEKEIHFTVSCSYGPGRYDKSYEVDSIDYPLGYVRWTEKRNFEAILSAFAKNSIKTKLLVSHSFQFNEVAEAYKVLLMDKNSLGIIINYDNHESNKSKKVFLNNSYIKNEEKKLITTEPFISFIGSGNYAKRFLIPLFSKAGAKFHSLISHNYSSSIYLGKKFSFPIVGTDVNEIFDNSNCNSVVIATRHDSHCELIIKALDAGKNVFVEKPLCLSLKELKRLESKYQDIMSKNSKIPLLMVGFNRRFSPLVKQLKTNLDKLNSTKSFIYTCNVGLIDRGNWIHNPNVGGGRLIGEACHFVDLLRFLADSEIKNLEIIHSPELNHLPDNFILQIQFKDGSIGSINYFTNGDKSYPKERLEVFCNGTIHRINNFRKLEVWGSNKFKNIRLMRQDKGQLSCIKEFLNSIKKGCESPIDVEELFEVQRFLLKVVITQG